MKNFMFARLEDEYKDAEKAMDAEEATEKTESEEKAEEAKEEMIARMPIREVVKAKMAVLEAILDKIAEDEKEKASEPDSTEVKTEDEKEEEAKDEAEKKMTEVAEAAVDSGEATEAIMKRIPEILDRHFGRTSSNRVALFARAAEMVTNRMADVEPHIEKVLDIDDEGVDLKKYNIIDNTAEPEGDNAQETKDTGIPTRSAEMQAFLEEQGEVTGPTDPAGDDLIAYKDEDTKPADDGENLEKGETPEPEGDSAQETADTGIPTRSPQARAFANWLSGRLEGDEITGPTDPAGDDLIAYKDEDTKPADEGVDISEEPAVPEGDSAQVSGAIPTRARAAIKALALSSVTKRRATVMVSREFSGILLNQMLHTLRYRLPEDFKRKYGIR